MNKTSLDPYEALRREAAHRLADTAAPYRVLTRQRLAALSGEAHWGVVSFEEALDCAVDEGVLNRLAPDMYEVPG
jgi:hypothetical protein